MTMHRPFAHARRRQNVLIDLSSTELTADSRAIDDALSAVIGQPHLRLVGVCCSVGTAAADSGLVERRVDQAIGVMEQVRRDYGLILTELIVGEDQDLATASGDGLPNQDALLAAIDDALDDACARNRYPRPAVILMTHPTVIAGAPAPARSVVR
ncbi:decarboxylase [Rhodococcus sp. ACS1]|uniref:decarboxylase n=1 Tax=Rhodococcus sp. ACS1 TaxID=2028570 RepID=UPI00211BB262|nr:decarboxylase [Rhodococcus sp. ACS1]